MTRPPPLAAVLAELTAGAPTLDEVARRTGLDRGPGRGRGRRTWCAWAGRARLGALHGLPDSACGGCRCSAASARGGPGARSRRRPVLVALSVRNASPVERRQRAGSSRREPPGRPRRALRRDGDVPGSRQVTALVVEDGVQDGRAAAPGSPAGQPADRRQRGQPGRRTPHRQAEGVRDPVEQTEGERAVRPHTTADGGGGEFAGPGPDQGRVHLRRGAGRSPRSR